LIGKLYQVKKDEQKQQQQQQQQQQQYSAYYLKEKECRFFTPEHKFTGVLISP